MTVEQWLERLSSRMIRAGLPVAYVRRCVWELADHIDQVGESGSMTTEISEDSSTALADQFVDSYRSAKWLRRLPAIVWTLVPVPLGVIVCVAYYATGLALIGTCTSALEREDHVGFSAHLLPWLYYVGQFVTPMIAMFVLQKLLATSGRTNWVGRISVVVLAFLFLATESSFQVPSVHQEGHLHVTISDETLADLSLASQQIVQVMIIVMIFVIDSARERKTRASICSEFS